MTCMCGAYDCPDCGPAQGQTVIRVRRPGGGWTYINPDDDDQPELDDDTTDEEEESTNEPG